VHTFISSNADTVPIRVEADQRQASAIVDLSEIVKLVLPRWWRAGEEAATDRLGIADLECVTDAVNVGWNDRTDPKARAVGKLHMLFELVGIRVRGVDGNRRGEVGVWLQYQVPPRRRKFARRIADSV
jgi:hypothetical protein